MQLLYAILLLQGLAFGSEQPNAVNTKETKCDSQNNSYIIGMSVHAIEAVEKRDHIPINYKICPENSSKCGADGTYSLCINDDWVERRCKCPELECRKKGMFNDCVVVTKVSKAYIK